MALAIVLTVIIVLPFAFVISVCKKENEKINEHDDEVM